MITIIALPEIENEINENWQTLIYETIEATLCSTGEANEQPDVTVLLANDAYLQELNQQFMGLDQPTDVLSFPIGETNPENGSFYLGDLAISLERAKTQAETGQNALEDELRLLVVHGVLHLLGHDHSTAEEKAHMWSIQAEILKSMGSRLILPIE